MTPELAIGIAVGVTVVVCGLVIGLGCLVIRYRKQIREINKARRENVLADLELATAEQLFAELRKRPNLPYLLLTPMLAEDAFVGIEIDCRNIPPVPVMMMLQMATSVVGREMKRNGVDLSEFPEFPNSND